MKLVLCLSIVDDSDFRAGADRGIFVLVGIELRIFHDRWSLPGIRFMSP